MLRLKAQSFHNHNNNNTFRTACLLQHEANKVPAWTCRLSHGLTVSRAETFMIVYGTADPTQKVTTTVVYRSHSRPGANAAFVTTNSIQACENNTVDICPAVRVQTQTRWTLHGSSKRP